MRGSRPRFDMYRDPSRLDFELFETEKYRYIKDLLEFS